MPEIRENISLKPYNTFGLDIKAAYFTEIRSISELKELRQTDLFKKQPRFILGGGSNILFTRDFEGLLIRNDLKGIEKVTETAEEVFIKAASGEVWHDVVRYCIAHNYGGIENLSLIPGTIGAAPIQNIGAYGVELKDVFQSLEAMELRSGEIKEFEASNCDFGYRDSIFKNSAKDQYFIISVTLRLKKQPTFNVSYGAIQQTLQDMGIAELSVAAISRAVCHIRNSKLPNPAVIGNAGSFFKNPEISIAQYEELHAKYPQMPSYPVGNDKMKIPAGWLIESCGWKGKRVGETGSHKDQALVLVNYGQASGSEIRDLAYAIQRSVKEKFGIDITPEVNIL